MMSTTNTAFIRTHAHTHTRTHKLWLRWAWKPLSPVYVWLPPAFLWHGISREPAVTSSLSQICLYSKEMHCTVEPSKWTVRILKAHRFKQKVHIASRTGRWRWAGWQAMKGILLNPWEIIWAPPPPLLPMFQWLGPWPLRQGKKCKTSSGSLGYMVNVQCWLSFFYLPSMSSVKDYTNCTFVVCL